jgi:hypothetical protein
MLADMGPNPASSALDDVVLLWPLDPAEETAEGVGVGSSVYGAWLAYPDAEALRPAPGAATDALLVTRAHRGYLILHDGARVRRILAGVEDLLRASYLVNVDEINVN